jgi:hypothetical protein
LEFYLSLRALQLNALAKVLGLVAYRVVVGEHVVVLAFELAAGSGGGKLMGRSRYGFVVKARRHTGAVCLIPCEATLA